MSQKCYCEVTDLFKEKTFYPCECISSFEKFKEILPDKNLFFSLLSDKENSNKSYQHVLKAIKFMLKM